MKTVYLIIIGILIAIALWLYLRPQEPVIDVKRVKTLQDKVKKAETLRQNVIVKAKQDSAEHTAVIIAKDAEILRLKRAAAKSKTPAVDTILIENPEVGQYAAFLDSIILQQDSQISELKEQKVDQWASFNQLITASDSTAQANKELNDFVNKALEGENKRLKHQNLGLKIGIVAIPVGIVALVLAK